jgi:CheY-like chemotaxis protein
MSPGQRCRVLLVEDEAAVSMLIEGMLLDLGVEVVGPATTNDAAMALAQEAEIEAAVLDINVRGTMTFPVADVLRARGIPIIFTTGYQASAVPPRFQGTPLLQKPFTMTAFKDVLRAALADAPCELPEAL